MNEDMLNSTLKELNDSSSEIKASALISIDGLIIAAALSESMDEDHVGAMSAAMLSLGDRTSQELEIGYLEQVLIKGDDGYVLMTHVGEEAVVTVLTKSTAKLGLIFLNVKRVVESLEIQMES